MAHPTPARPRRRRPARLLAALLLAAMALAACSTPAPPGPTPAAPGPTSPPAGSPTDEPTGTTISFAAWEGEKSMYEALAKRFMQEHPEITVVVVPLDDLMMPSDPSKPEGPTDSLRRIVSGADTAAAFMVPREAFGTPLLLDLKPLMDADASFSRDDFYPGALERGSSGGGVWWLPRSFYVQTLTYNRQLFQAAGLPEPKAGWTWADLLAAAEAVAKSGGSGTVGFFDTSGGMLPLAAALSARGVDLASPPQDLNLTDKAVADALAEVLAAYRSRTIGNPYGDGTKPVDPSQMLRDGQVGIWSDPQLIGPDGQPEPLPYEVGRVPYPASPFLDTIFGSGGEGYIVSGGTASPEAAWKWVEFLSRQPIQRPGEGSFRDTGRLPARKALADAIKYWDGLDEQSAAAFRWTLEHTGTSDPRAVDYNLFGALGQALGQTLSDPKADPDKALADAQRQLEESRAQVGLTPTPLPDTSPVIVATPAPQTAPEGATTIRFALWGISGPDVRRILRTFNEQHPEIFVQLQSTDTFTTTVSAADLAKVSDCFTSSPQPTSQKDLDALLDLRPLMDADQSFPRDDVPPALLSAYEHDGALYGMPYAFNVRTLTYNRSLFDKAGVTPPGKTPMTTEQFLQLAQALSSGEGESRVYGYVSLGGPMNDLGFFVSQAGASLTTGSGADMRANFSDPAVVKAIQDYLDLSAVHKVSPPPTVTYRRDSQAPDRSYEYISNSRGAMWMDYGRGGFGGPIDGPGPRPADAVIVNKDTGVAVAGGPIGGGGAQFEVGVAPLPIGEGGLSPADMYMRGFHISRASQHPRECWELIKFLTTDVSQMYGDLPARTSVAQSEAFKAVAGPDRLELLDLYSTALSRPMRPGDPAAFATMDPYWLMKAIDEAMTGKVDLKTGLDAAEKTTNTFLACVAKGGKLPACALEADPDYQGYNTDMPGKG